MTCRIYVLTPPRIDLAALPDQLAAALDAGDVAAVQLRLKDADDALWISAIAALRPLAQSRGVAFLLNDRADLAVAHGCDGAHVGQEDMPAAEARRALGELTLGVTCHASRELAMQAGEDGADYVAFGAFFPSTTKPGTTKPGTTKPGTTKPGTTKPGTTKPGTTKDAAPVLAEPDLLSWWSELMELPVVAIGGITAQNCAPLVAAGADFLAVTAAIWDHPDGPAAGVRTLQAAIRAARP